MCSWASPWGCRSLAHSAGAATEARTSQHCILGSYSELRMQVAGTELWQDLKLLATFLKKI